MIKRAAGHKGAAFLEVLQNCVIYNDGAFDLMTSKKTRDDYVLYLEHGKPMIYGLNKDKGIVFEGGKVKAVEIGEGKYKVEDILVHDEYEESGVLATILSHMTNDPSLPTPLGVFKQISRSTYDGDVEKQIAEVKKIKGEADLEKVLFNGNTWDVN